MALQDTALFADDAKAAEWLTETEQALLNDARARQAQTPFESLRGNMPLEGAIVALCFHAASFRMEHGITLDQLDT